MSASHTGVVPHATLHDGSTIDIHVRGDGPTVLLPVNPQPVEGPRAQELLKWGTDPALGQHLIDGLGDAFRTVAFDYEGQVMAHPKPHTLTPTTLAQDILAVADAAGADRFAYYGYSWLALAGLQLAIRTDRLTALVMGGFPPIDGPYPQMLRVTAATHDMTTAPKPPKPAEESPTSEEFDWASVEVQLTPEQTGQFLTLYEALRGFDDRTVRLDCPRLCFAGAADEIDYGERWGGVHVSMAGPLQAQGAQLEARGWSVRVLAGLDHTQAMQASAVLPVIRPWLTAVLRSE